MAATTGIPPPDLEQGRFGGERDSGGGVGIGDSAAATSSSGLDIGEFERDCRICHLGLGSDGDRSIDLGCSCKGDLAAAHKNCAQDWFNIRGNRTCEICHSVAQNIAAPEEGGTIVHTSDTNNTMSVSAVSTLASPDRRNSWHGHRFLNFLLACMVVAFVISWLFHFRVPSHH